jgi:hypothetical protein
MLDANDMSQGSSNPTHWVCDDMVDAIESERYFSRNKPFDARQSHGGRCDWENELAHNQLGSGIIVSLYISYFCIGDFPQQI